MRKAFVVRKLITHHVTEAEIHNHREKHYALGREIPARPELLKQTQFMQRTRSRRPLPIIHLTSKVEYGTAGRLWQPLQVNSTDVPLNPTEQDMKTLCFPKLCKPSVFELSQN